MIKKVGQIWHKDIFNTSSCVIAMLDYVSLKVKIKNINVKTTGLFYKIILFLSQMIKCASLKSLGEVILPF